ncbi:MAG: bifunctional DNA-formamidopyrimidine glycosylase/DNA-(apurinic or apyrimidinic site) lyase [Planctomycetota bacterium]
MPELPEVETTRRSVASALRGRRFERVVVRERALRWPVPARLTARLAGCRVLSVERRAKYLLMRTDRGAVILHLGMSGSLRLVDPDVPPRPHDHVDFWFDAGQCLRLHDPRRFGAVLWTPGDPLEHPLLRELGPEPLGSDLTPEYLHLRARGRRRVLRDFLLDGRVLAGVGNIYANEAAHRAGIHPLRAAGRVALPRYRRLVTAIRDVLAEAIARGGTTLRDFVDGHGQAGGYGDVLTVYDREGRACRTCGELVRRRAHGARSVFYCSVCQR